ncbi:gluconate kinase, FGGY family [Quadrisphaera granulorum]|uniref:Gluconate kinase (FGGY family) n=1 Tax=Quadrisphaera granulorum TaxID=317664 RepID=A0A316AFG0_9ACTN|nr:gluconokinase [Quadrisphaera granulorum]PWJ56483.1 gluconate kinase (FGGY family) [Quadrisphaera granulorum]SZE95117.1 gluconate kinase, FGGY family [Quadrisphaera granulorum]
MEPAQRTPAVVGIDIGTTATKAVAFTPDGAAVASASVPYPLLVPSPGYAEQDPAVVLAAIRTATAAAVRRARRLGTVDVVGISFSSAMHSLIGVDALGAPLTPLITWADTRSAPQAEALSETPTGRRLHELTGTPVHAMSPLCKVLWFRENQPSLAEAVDRWVGVKDLLLHRWCGDWVIDHSTASGTGLMDLASLQWSPLALETAGLAERALPRLVPSTDASLRLLDDVAGDLGLDPGVSVVAGGGDGPLSNLAVGALEPGVAACSIGTSGALRLTTAAPSYDPAGRSFCYALLPGRWVIGGAINNGGAALRWAADTFAADLVEIAPELGDAPESAVTDLAARAPAGCEGLVVLPYLFSERAPHWSSLPSGACIGLRSHHRREHLVRAVLEGVCQQLALVLDALRSSGHTVTRVHATGGFAASPLWRQMLADCLGLTVTCVSAAEGSAWGAAALGLQAIGLVGSVDELPAPAVVQVVEPDPATVAVYSALRPVHEGLYRALVPLYRQLRDLETLLPSASSEAFEVEVEELQES